MKKLISLFLSLLMIFSCIAFCASAADEEELKITVATDLHYDLTATTVEKVRQDNPLSEDFAHVASGGQLHYESVAIILSFLDSIKDNDTDYVLLSGDLTNYGVAAEHLAFSKLFSEFEKETGKKVFVVPGNHDYLKTSVSEFKAYYAELGYNEALEVHDKTASYTVDLDDGYRLLALDSCSPGEGAHGVTKETVEWVAAQGEKAKQDGKKLIAMMHHNPIEHIMMGGALFTGSVIKEEELDFPNVLANAGIKYTFTGHTHQHDIASYEAEDGTVIYSVVGGSLHSYPSPYRFVTFGDEVKIETKNVDSIDVSLLPPGISEAALSLAESNFLEYAKKSTYIGLEYRLYQYANGSGLNSLLKIEDEEIRNIILKVGDRLHEAAYFPLYKEDETQEGVSIESYAQMYKTTLPKTDYKTSMELIAAIYQEHAEGDENLPSYSDEVILVSRALAVVLNYTLAELTAEEYATVLDFAAGYLGADLPVDLLVYAGDALKRFEGCEIFVTTAIIPIIADFCTDDAPADLNAVLPGYSELVEEKAEETVLDKILSFFQKMLNFVLTIFAFLPF